MSEQSPKQAVMQEYPSAACMHVPQSMAVAIYCKGKMISSEAIDAKRAWESAARRLHLIVSAVEGASDVRRF